GAGEGPAFAFPVTAFGRFEKLPDPGPIGLQFDYDGQKVGKKKILVTDEDLKSLPTLKNLQALVFRFSTAGRVTDAGMKEIAKNKNLKWLGIHGAKITGAGVKELAVLEHLEYLEVPVAITDTALKELPALKKLKFLVMHPGTNVTDAGLQGLAGMKLR